MGRYVQSFIVIIGMALLVLFAAEPKEERDLYGEMVEGHTAFKLFKDGVWEIRYIIWLQEYAGKITYSEIQLSANLKKDMTKEQALEVMDYYELTRNSKFDNHTYEGERETDFVCYATFYRGNTDEIVWRIKYLNGKEAELTEEDLAHFPTPESHTPQSEMGEWP